MRPRTISLAIVCAVALAGLFGPLLRPSAQQQKVRLPGCACFVCGDLQVQAGRQGVNLPFNYLSLEDPNCEAGILAESACPAALAELPREKVESFCQRLKAGLKFTSFKQSCPILAKACEPDGAGPPPEKKCDPPLPWTDSSARRCQDLQPPQITVDQKSASVSVAMCGITIFKTVPAGFEKGMQDFEAQAYRSAMKGFFPGKICCESFHEAVRSGKPCDPRVDVDCDGKPNQSDINDKGWPVFEQFSSPAGPPADSYNFPDDPNFVPSPADCACKWELVKGRLDCSPDGKGRDFYHASWKCNSNGLTRETRRERPASQLAPCSK